MLQKFKMKTFAAALGLFGFVLFSAAPVFASDSLDERFKQCQSIKAKGDFKAMKRKKDCFKELVRDERQIAAAQVTSLNRNFNVELEELKTRRHELACNVVEGGSAKLLEPMARTEYGEMLATCEQRNALVRVAVSQWNFQQR